MNLVAAIEHAPLSLKHCMVHGMAVVVVVVVVVAIGHAPLRLNHCKGGRGAGGGSGVGGKWTCPFEAETLAGWPWWWCWVVMCRTPCVCVNSQEGRALCGSLLCP